MKSGSCPILLIAATALVLFLVFSMPVRGQGVAMEHELHPVPLQFEGAHGLRHIEVEIADEAHEHSHGLMFRQDLAQDRGLLFVFGQTGRKSFWMKNTPLPLDLVFIAGNGRVAAIRKGQPFDLSPISPASPARFVLELNQGAAERLGLRVGTKLRHPVIDAVSGAH